MKKATVTRPIQIPDLKRISRCERAPDLGPGILFFSGGTALNEVSRELKKFTHNSTHLITPFDSGGSSAVLREVFHMPAIGDLRSRLMALADETIGGHPEIIRLFAYRLPKSGKHKDLNAQLKAMGEGKDPRVAAIKNPMRRIIRQHLQTVIKAMPEKMDLRGASIGNLILAGGYLNNGRRLEPVIFMFAKLVNALGKVNPVVEDCMHLAVHLKNGETVAGQHRFTGKETTPLKEPVKELVLIKGPDDTSMARVSVSKKVRRTIKEAELICYPPGSFYSSLVANLLPEGVGRSIAANPCPKVYFPGLGNDPERLGLSAAQSVFTLIDYLKKDAGEDCPVEKLLNFVLIDSQNGEAFSLSDRRKLRKAGVTVIDTQLVNYSSTPYYDPQLFVLALLSLS